MLKGFYIKRPYSVASLPFTNMPFVKRCICLLIYRTFALQSYYINTVFACQWMGRRVNLYLTWL